MSEKNWQFELEEYIRQGEPDKIEKSEAWQTAIGLQAVDGLKTSEYLLDTDYELKNRYMHVDYVDSEKSQSAKIEVPKCQFSTLDCTLEEPALLELIAKNPAITQQELADISEKSLRTVKRLMKSLQDKNYIRRKSGKRYGKWEVLV